MKENEEMDRLTRAVRNAHNKCVKPGEVSKSCFVTRTKNKPDGEYICLVEQSGKQFYMVIDLKNGFWSGIGFHITILSFARLPIP